MDPAESPLVRALPFIAGQAMCNRSQNQLLFKTRKPHGETQTMASLVRRLLGVAASICMHKAGDHQSWKHDHHALIVGDDDPPT